MTKYLYCKNFRNIFKFLELKESQNKQKNFVRGCYYDGDSDYVYVDKLGHLRKPHYITQHFFYLIKLKLKTK